MHAKPSGEQIGMDFPPLAEHDPEILSRVSQEDTGVGVRKGHSKKAELLPVGSQIPEPSCSLSLPSSRLRHGRHSTD